MHVPPATSPAFSLGLGDIYYVLFRHKWKIMVCSLIGLAGAVALYKLRPPPYQSDAKLLIKYVSEEKVVNPAGNGQSIVSLDQRESVISSELEILTSLDLAKQVASFIGPDKLLGKAGADRDPATKLDWAAYLVRKNFAAEVSPKSSVLILTFKHPDKDIVQPVLAEIVSQYLKRHIEFHGAAGLMSDSLTQATDTLRQRLAQTEEELRKATNKAGVISLDDAKKAYTEQIAKITQEIFAAEAEFAERSSVYHEVAKHSPAEVQAADTAPEPTPEQVTQYRNLVSREASLQKREQYLLGFLKPDTSWVQQVHVQLADVADQKKKLEEESPKLTRVTVTPVPAAGAPADGSARPVDLVAEAARLNALQAKIKVLNSQRDEIRGEADKLDQMEGTISELRRKKEIEEKNYEYYSKSLESKRIDAELGSASGSNISEIQTPSPPLRDWGTSLKMLGMVAIGGMGIGLGWAFLIEMYFDRTIKRPIDVERMAKLPLFLSIPILGRSEVRRLKAAAGERLSLPAPDDDPAAAPATNGTPLDVSAALATMGTVDLLHDFHETLRDRLIGYFESINLTHKPKLVAVTGLGRDSGVTTIAAGLAGSLSETGDGNVLLVDMTQGQGSAQQFYKGKAVCGLEEVLDVRGNAQIQDNLFVVGEGRGGDKLSRILPQRFNKLVPKLKASNFDYIIFDMPPVSQLSITPRLAGFMDMVLLVIESEKTDQALVQRATAMLAESKAHVGAVLNKTKTYVPPRLHQESLGNL
jgi:uncharacterized protein involved in exopolysaccharide biosynthesis/Mrp family chromosome partitioning ATPase